MSGRQRASSGPTVPRQLPKILCPGTEFASDADPRDVDISEDGSTAYVPSGAIAGDDSVYVIDTSLFAVVDTISMAPGSNPNVVAVAPEFGLGIFSDGFESGDTTRWSASVP